MSENTVIENNNDQPVTKNKKLIIISSIIAVILLCCTAFVVYLSSNYVIISDNLFKGKLCDISLTQLDLRDSDLKELNNIERMENLRNLDIRGCEVSANRYKEIKDALPDCEILWSVPLGNKRFDSNTESVSVDNSTDFSNLSFFPYLKNVDASQCTNYDELITASASMSHVSFVWNVTVEGNSIPNTTEEIKLSSNASAADIEALKYISSLKYADATECTLYDELLALSGTVSGCDVEWTINIGDCEVSSLTEKIDLRGHTVSDPSVITSALPYLPRVTYIDMCGCGLTNEQMQTLRETYPNIKFVWYVSFLTYENVRTDIQVFSSLRYSKSPYTLKDYEPLILYCTDLVALDLGHNSIKDLTPLTNLKKLKCLLMTDNSIVDLSPLAELKELELVELASNRIADFSPLAELPKLTDMNVGFNNPYNYDTLEGLQCPKRIWMTQRNIGLTPAAIKQKIKALYPDCETCYFAGYSDASGIDWISADHYKAYRKAFKNWRYVKYFNSWDDHAFMEGVPLWESSIK